ncbi:MAG: leucine-rich repeat protein, partial [Clostridia bacterium]|nr:leucine-rich repeat protein [Clostridia bacterium]
LNADNSLKYIGEGAFKDLPKAVFEFASLAKLETVRSMAFFNAVKLTTFNAPALKELGAGVFENCQLLQTLTAPSSLSAVKLLFGESSGAAVDGFYEVDGYLIPEALTTLKVTLKQDFEVIPAAFAEGLVSITELYLPEGLIQIGERAFYRISTVLLSLPDSLESIEMETFAANAALISINIGANSALEGIGERAFADCVKLQSLTVPMYVSDFLLSTVAGCSAITDILVHEDNETYFDINGVLYADKALIYYPLGREANDFIVDASAQTIGHLAFAGSKIKNLYLPAGILSAEADSFIDCKFDKVSMPAVNKLSNVFADSSVISLLSVYGENIPAFFAYTEKISSLEVAEGVEEINMAAFSDCLSLESVSLPSTLKVIGIGAFLRCEKLADISFADENSLEFINFSVFGNTPWLSAFPDGEMIYIGKIAYLFKGVAADNTTLTLRDGTVCVASFALAEQAGITSVVFPDTLEQIYFNAFENTGITALNFNSNLRRIGDAAFQDCINLESVAFAGSAVEEIGEYAFNDASSLASLDALPSVLTRIHDYAFSGTAISGVAIPASVIEIGAGAFSNCILLEDISFEALDNVTNFGEQVFHNTKWYNDSADGALMLDGKNIYGYKGAMPENYELSIQPNVERILPYAFYGQQNLVTVRLRNSLKTIGEYAFAECTSLTNVYTVTDSSLVNLGDWAFDGCISLQEFTLTQNVAHFNPSVFNDCASLTRFIVDEEDTSDNFRFIGDILYNADKTRILYVPHGISGAVTIERTVTEIEEEAFISRIGITSVVIHNAITSIGEYAFSGCLALSNVTFGDNPLLADIGANAFGETDISSITLPRRLAYIGDEAFDYENVEITFTGDTPPEVSGEVVASARVYVPREALAVYRERLPLFNIFPSRIKIDFIKNNAVYASYEVPFGGKLSAIPTLPTEEGYSAQWNAASLALVWDTENSVFLAVNDDVPIVAVYTKNTYTVTMHSQDITVLNYVYDAAISGITPLSADGRQFLFWTENLETPQSFSTTRMPARNIELYPVWFDFSFTLDDSTDTWGIAAPITTLGIVPADIRIPATYQGKAVTAILESAFSGFDGLAQVTLPDSVTTIMAGAFQLSSLNRISISNNSQLSEIGDSAFFSTDIITINLPKILSHIGDFAFAFSSKLTHVEITVTDFENMGVSIFDSCSSLGAVEISVAEGGNAQYLSDQMFVNCISLETVVLPEGLRNLGYETFKNCHSLQNFSLPELEIIGESAFEACYSLQTIELPEVTQVHAGAFEDCTSLIVVEFRDNDTLLNIAQNAFSGCSELAYFVAPASLKVIGEGAFYDCNKLKYLVVEENGSIEDGSRGLTIAEGALPLTTVIYVATALEMNSTKWPQHTVALYRGIYDGFVAGVDGSLLLYVGGESVITMPALIESDRVEIIGDDLFYGSDCVSEIYLEDSYLISLLDSAVAFRNLKNLVSFNSPYSIGGVLYNQDTTSLIAYPQSRPNELFAAPASVTQVSDYAFYSVALLEAVTFSALAPPLIGENTFGARNTDLKIYVPASALEAYRTAPYWSALASIIYADYVRHGDFLFVDHAEGLELSQYLGHAQDVALPISLNGKNVVSIGAYAFYGSGIYTVAIPTSIFYIKDYAFSNCENLTAVALPDGTKSIGRNAFSSCVALTTLTLSSRIKLTEIKESAFENCTALKCVVLPVGIRILGKNAFAYCSSLESFSFAQNNELTTIGEGAFYGCTALAAINIDK